MLSEKSFAQGHHQLSTALFTHNVKSTAGNKVYSAETTKVTRSQNFQASMQHSNKAYIGPQSGKSTAAAASSYFDKNQFGAAPNFVAPKDFQIRASNCVKRTPTTNMSMSMRRSNVQNVNARNGGLSLAASIGQRALFGGMDAAGELAKGGNRSQLKNLKMNLKEADSQAASQFKINSDAKDTKQVVINDNFLDFEFKEGEVSRKGAGQTSTLDLQPLPMWASGLDQEYVFDTDLNQFCLNSFDVISRSTSNVNPLTQSGIDAMLDYQKSLETKKLSVEDLYEMNRAKIMDHFKLPEGTGIFFAPSEASAQYLVIAIVAALNPDKESFHHVITGTRRDEIDENVLLATEARFFSSQQVPHKVFDQMPKREAQVSGLPNWSTSQVLDNRQVDGVENDYYDKVFDIFDLCENDDQATLPILQSMGSLDKYMENIWWKIHDCGDIQVYNHREGRVETEKLQKHLRNGDLFIFSGSRFYRSPLDCAAMVVPPSVMERLTFVQKQYPDNLKQQWFGEHRRQLNSLNYFFGKNDFPKELDVWRENIDKNENAGLALRWSVATASMEQLSQYEGKPMKNKELAWKQKMTELLKGMPILRKESLLSPFVSSETSPKNLQSKPQVTVAVLEREKLDQTWLTKADLTLINRMMAMDMSDKIDWEYQLENHKAPAIDALGKGNVLELKKIAAQKVYLSPPTRKPAQITSEDGAIQIALSYDGLKSQMELKSSGCDMEEDKTVLSKLAIIAYAYPELKKQMDGQFTGNKDSSHSAEAAPKKEVKSSSGQQPTAPQMTEQTRAEVAKAATGMNERIIQESIQNLEAEIAMKEKQLQQWKSMVNE